MDRYDRSYRTRLIAVILSPAFLCVQRKPLVTFALGILIATVIVSAFFLSQQGGSAQQLASVPKAVQGPKILQDLKILGQSTTNPGVFLVIDAGNDRGIWASNGFNPEFVVISGRSAVVAADIKDSVASGAKVGITPASEILLARSAGVPVKIVADYVGVIGINIFVKADGPIKTVKDLDGKKIGSPGGATNRHIMFVANKFAIKPEVVVLDNTTNLVVALKLGRIDAFGSNDLSPLRLVESGELRIIARGTDYLPRPWAVHQLWATEDVIEHDPELVKSWIKATLETVKYINEHPGYASDLYIARTGASRDFADRAVAIIQWTPSGLGRGQDVVAVVANVWHFSKESGGIPPNVEVNLEDAVDVRFLP